MDLRALADRLDPSLSSRTEAIHAALQRVRDEALAEAEKVARDHATYIKNGMLGGDRLAIVTLVASAIARLRSAADKPPCNCSCHWSGVVEMHFMPCCGTEKAHEFRPPTEEEALEFARLRRGAP